MNTSNTIKAAMSTGILITGLMAAGADALADVNKTVPAGQAVVTDLGANASAVSYWAETPDGWQVVTTIDTVSGRDTDRERHAVVRFSATLQPGQTQLISVPFGVGEQQQVLRIRRIGDQIEVERVAGSSV